MIDPSRCTNSHCLSPPISLAQVLTAQHTLEDSPHKAGERNTIASPYWLGCKVALHGALSKGRDHVVIPSVQHSRLCVLMAQSVHPQCSLMRKWLLTFLPYCYIQRTRNEKAKVFLAESGPLGISLEPHTSLLSLCSPHPVTWVTESNKTKN